MKIYTPLRIAGDLYVTIIGYRNENGGWEIIKESNAIIGIEDNTSTDKTRYIASELTIGELGRYPFTILFSVGVSNDYIVKIEELEYK